MKTLMMIETVHGGMLFSLTYLAAFLVGIGMAVYTGFKKGYPRSTWLLILLSGVIFFIIGDKILTYSPEQWGQVFTKFHFPRTERKTILGGIAGLFVGIYLAKIWLRFKPPVFDNLAVALPVTMAISRIGCLMSGCCFGTPTTLPWGIQYDASSWAYQAHLAQGAIHPGDITSLPVHPVQAYQVIGCLIIALILWSTRNRWKGIGNLFLFSVLSYVIFRFFIEFVRAPESNFFTGQFFWGLKIIQWILLAVLFLGIPLFIIKENRAKTILATTNPILVSDSRQILLIILGAIIFLSCRNWLTFIESATFLLFLIPVIIIQFVKIYRSHTAPCYRWVVPAVFICSFSFMAQKSISTKDHEDKTTFTDVGIIGTFGSYFEAISRAGTSYSDCNGNYSTLTPIGTQKRTFQQGGIDISHNIWEGKYNKKTFGARGFYGVESGGITPDYPNSNITIGVNPYMYVDHQYFGYGIGFSLGQMKISKGKYQSLYPEGAIVSPDYSNATFIPSLSLRGGPIDIIYAETSLPGLFHSTTPFFPPFQIGLGSGLGKTNGTKAAFGYCDKGIYAQFVYPIKNKVVLEAFYGDNLQNGENAKSAFSFGIHYRISPKKSISK